MFPTSSKLFIIVYLFTLFSCNQQKGKDCNYIKSGYYQLVYQADLELLKGNKEKAYELLLKAEKTCEMLETSMFYEISNLVSLALEFEDYGKALYYMDYLIEFRGYKLNAFTDLVNYNELSKRPNWEETLANFQQKEYNFVSDTCLLDKIVFLEERDQLYRIALMQNRVEQCSINNDSLMLLVKQADDSNYNELKTLFTQKALSFDRYKKISSIHKSIIEGSLQTILMHIAIDHNDFDTIVLESIAQGKLFPYIYGMMIDRRKLEERQAFVYGIYENATPDQILDPDNLDNRRISVGMPPIVLEKERRNILMNN